MNKSKEYIATLFSCSSPMLQYCSFLLHSGITICLSAEYSHIGCKKAANMSKRVAMNIIKVATAITHQ